MFHNDLYAKFADIFDAPEEPRAVFQPDGKIEFVNGESAAQSMEDVSDKRQLAPFKPSPSLQRKMLIFAIFCVLVVILTIISIINLVLLVENQKRIANTSASVQGMRDANLLINGTPADVHGLKDILVPLLNKDIEEALADFKANVTGHVRDQALTPEYINNTVDRVLQQWGGGVLNRLQNLNMDSSNLQNQLNMLLANLSTFIIHRLRVELGISQYLFERRVVRILTNLTSTTVDRLKEELEIDPVHLDRAVHRALNNLSRRSLALIRGICEIAYGDKCYWIVKSGSIPYKQAEALCEARGAMAANIYSQSHYQAMLSYARKKMADMNTLWIGMTRNPSTNNVYYVNGTQSGWTIPWAPNYPNTDATANRLGITFSKNESGANADGFFNDAVQNRKLGILCEL